MSGCARLSRIGLSAAIAPAGWSPRALERDGTFFLGRLLRQLRRRCSGRTGQDRLRTAEVRAAGGFEEQIRSDESFPAQPKHQTNSVTAPRPCERGDSPAPKTASASD